jgi:hypothetical protein
VTSKGEQRDAQVHLVTSARRPHSEEISGRTRRYLISMGIRTVALVLAIFVLDGWLRVVGIAIAIVLPWFAVVLANAGPVIGDESPEYVTVSRPELEERKPDDVSGADGVADHATDGQVDDDSAPTSDQTIKHRNTA